MSYCKAKNDKNKNELDPGTSLIGFGIKPSVSIKIVRNNNDIGGCFDKNALINIIHEYNNKYSTKIMFKLTDTRHVLFNKIKNALSSKCNSANSAELEVCWSKQDFFPLDINKYYKPKKPIGKYKVLFTNDIENALNHYQEVYTDFIFFGVFPLDFSLIYPLFKYFSLKKFLFEKQKLRFGCVFNLDKILDENGNRNNNTGSHWVALYANFKGKDKYVGYFDSYGDYTTPDEMIYSYGNCSAPKEIMDFMALIKKQYELLSPGNVLKLKSNSVRHQFKNSECGMYCIYFIYNCVNGFSFESICNTKIEDDEVNVLRDYFFRPN